MKHGKLMTALRRDIARRLREVRAQHKPITAWDACIIVGSRFTRSTIAYRTVREVAIKFKPMVGGDNA